MHLNELEAPAQAVIYPDSDGKPPPPKRNLSVCVRCSKAKPAAVPADANGPAGVRCPGRAPSMDAFQMPNHRLPQRRVAVLLDQRPPVAVGNEKHILRPFADGGNLGVLQLNAAFQKCLTHPRQ